MRNTSIKWLVKEEGTVFFGNREYCVNWKGYFCCGQHWCIYANCSVDFRIAVTELSDFTKVKVACCWWSCDICATILQNDIFSLIWQFPLRFYEYKNKSMFVTSSLNNTYHIRYQSKTLNVHQNKTGSKQEKVKHSFFYRDGLCWSLAWYANSGSVMESALCHKMVTWSSSVMLGRGNSSVYFRYTGRVRIFGHFFAVCLVVYLNKRNIDNDVFKLILDSSVTLLCGCYVHLYHTQSWLTTS